MKPTECYQMMILRKSMIHLLIHNNLKPNAQEVIGKNPGIQIELKKHNHIKPMNIQRIFTNGLADKEDKKLKVLNKVIRKKYIKTVKLHFHLLLTMMKF